MILFVVRFTKYFQKHLANKTIYNKNKNIKWCQYPIIALMILIKLIAIKNNLMILWKKIINRNISIKIIKRKKEKEYLFIILIYQYRNIFTLIKIINDLYLFI